MTTFNLSTWANAAYNSKTSDASPTATPSSSTPVPSAASVSKALTSAQQAIARSKQSQNIASLNGAIKNLQNQVTTYKTNISNNNTLIAEYKNYIATGKGPLDESLSPDEIISYGNQVTSLQSENTKLQNKITVNNTLIAADAQKVANAFIEAPAGTGKNTGNNKNSKVNITSAQTQTPAAPPEFPDSSYQWNLPPHAWSLPVEPSTMVDTMLQRTDDFHTTRRGRIFYYNGYVGPSSSPNYQDIATTGMHTPAANTPPSVNKYGFQFIWNPETFTQSTAVNMQVTPSGSDPSVALTGFAAANSQMEFTLRLDRTNDFACAETIYTSSTGVSLDSIAKYYSTGNSDSSGASTIDKITQLLEYGTEADLEYLYKTVNGAGWKGIGGRDTSNIGYLMPSLIRVDLGQQKFVGVVSSVSVNHLAFTRDMVPIRTDVDITIDLRANIQPTTNTGSGH